MRADRIVRVIRCWWDVLLLGAMIATINVRLLIGGNTDYWAFYSGAVSNGQWWRLITNDFAHGGLSHLLAVGLIFWILYLSLEEKRPLRRLTYVFASSIAANASAVLFDPATSLDGMRGLSGVVHGLLGVWALERILLPGRSPAQRSLGLAVLLVTIGKVVVELKSDWSLYAALHLGGAGGYTPACHAGGLIAGMMAFACFRVSALSGRWAP